MGPPQSSGMAGAPPTQAMPPGPRTFNPGTDPNRNMVQAGKVCSRLAQIQCAGEAYCCDNPGRDVAACEVKMADLCTKELFVDAITIDTRAGFDAARAATALQTFEEMASRCDPMIGDYGADPDGLMAMVRGTVDKGGRCSPGVTTDKARAAVALASCRNSATIACLPTSALNWSCTDRAAAGSNCFTDLNCTDGHWCPNPEFKIGMAQCVSRKADGMNCAAGNECLSLTCTTGKCAAPTKQSAYCLQ